MYTLVVIDMQPYFKVMHGSRVVENTIREITAARQQSADILFVEYTGCGPTLDSLREAASDYDRQFTAIKSFDDGSSEVHDMILNHNLNKAHLKVVGVNTDCCVFRTVAGLTSRVPNTTIEVVADACDSDFNHLGGLESIRNLNCGVRITKGVSP